MKFSKGLKHELLKLSQIIEVSTESLKTHDYNNIETTEIEKTLDTIHSRWVKYLKVYEDYSQLTNNTRDLERLRIQRQSLERKINECNQLAIDQLNKSIRSLQRDSKFENGLHLKDDDKLSMSVQSSVSMSRSSKSRRSGGSSVSSKVKTAARSAELARLKLEQAERRAKAKEKQMFNQVKVSPEDQDAFRFLWWSGSLYKPPDEYVMTVHVFGATDSPSCANYCLKRTAEDNKSEFDNLVVDTVLRHFYVDDMLRALKNEEIAIKVAKSSMSLFSRGGFKLTKFM